jgi:hypothetical protein
MEFRSVESVAHGRGGDDGRPAGRPDGSGDQQDHAPVPPASNCSKGKTENVVISSRGTIQLGRAAKVLASNFDDVWSVNSIVARGGTVYIGTSPNGSIYKYRLGAVTKIYPTEGQSPIDKDQPAVPKAPPSGGGRRERRSRRPGRRE